MTHAIKKFALDLQITNYIFMSFQLLSYSVKIVILYVDECYMHLVGVIT